MSAIRESGMGFGGHGRDDEYESPFTAQSSSQSSSQSPSQAKSTTINLDEDLIQLKTSTKNYEETKKIMENFNQKMKNPPNYMSYEGSMVVCVLLSLQSPANIRPDALPEIDKKLILRLIGNDTDGFGLKFTTIDVVFDEQKNFSVSVKTPGKATKNFTIINTVAHPRTEDLADISHDVKLNENGDKIEVGDLIILNKAKIAKFMKLSGVPQNKRADLSELDPKTTAGQVITKPVVSGRNAFEIRTDVLNMALNFHINKKVESNATEDDILLTARKFYSFVENRR